MKAAKKTLRLIGSISSIVLNAIMGFLSAFVLLIAFARFLGLSFMGVIDEEAFIYRMTLIFYMAVLMGLSIIISGILCANKGAKVMAVILIVINIGIAIFEFILMTNLLGIAAGSLSLLTVGIVIAFACLEFISPKKAANALPVYEDEQYFLLGGFTPSQFGLIKRIEVLDKLKDEGKITDEEYRTLILKGCE